jgi:signal transduction histidine kinase
MSDLPRLTELRDACQALAAAPGFLDLLNRTMETALQLAGAERGFLILHNRNTKNFEVRAASGMDGEAASQGELWAAAQTAAETGHSALVADEASLQRSSMAVALQARGNKPFGAIYLDKPSISGLFTHADLLFFEVFAAQAATALDANIARSDFVSVVSHELRLPMTSIKGYTDLMRSGIVGPVNDQQKEFLATIRNGVDRMNALISDLSDISKIETGRLKVEIKVVDVTACAEDAIAALKPQIDDKGQTLALNLPPLPNVRIDRSRLNQIITSLLTNAHKYTPPGGAITLTAHADDSRLRLAVADTGVGISPDDRLRIFSPFFRSDHPAVREQTGWGLALHLSRRLVELFGGQIGFESELDKGSTFWFTVPLASQQ